ncbi:unnamed protein product [Blepharisma stoltei]|uniref:Uncharacterized protein n=1 Tax=Blepharisma stoltei TaxID=1481888 RepID=A0AAU9JM39_9CILI|nr:unnamed protein product [Blepharisma stoltei]
MFVNYLSHLDDSVELNKHKNIQSSRIPLKVIKEHLRQPFRYSLSISPHNATCRLPQISSHRLKISVDINDFSNDLSINIEKEKKLPSITPISMHSKRKSRIKIFKQLENIEKEDAENESPIHQRLRPRLNKEFL